MVIMGVWNPSNLTNTQSSTVAQIKIHESFVPSTLKNDIAILTLTQPIVLGIYPTINTICLPSTGASTSYVGQMYNEYSNNLNQNNDEDYFQVHGIRMGSKHIYNKRCPNKPSKASVSTNYSVYSM